MYAFNPQYLAHFCPDENISQMYHSTHLINQMFLIQINVKWGIWLAHVPKWLTKHYNTYFPSHEGKASL